MIPKIIHYCWFGRNPLPPLAEKCIASWREFLPDYEIKEWNEDNFDVNINPYTAEAYKAKKYAFVSDYARFWILYQYGGLYFDTDVEVIKSIDDIVERGPFMGCERYADNSGSKGATTLGVAPGLGLGANPGLGLGANPGLGLYKKFLERYDTLDFTQEREKNKTIVHYTTELLVSEGLSNTSEIQYVGGIYVYPKEYFCPINQTTHRINITDNTRSIHHYAATWTDKTRGGGYKTNASTVYSGGTAIDVAQLQDEQKAKEGIPKIIHLCWLSGDEYPNDIKLCLESWKQHLPDYEVWLWDTKRFDINSTTWTKQAFENKKYAFAADYIRLYALYHYGGIYLDSDVMVYKSFAPLLSLPYFIGQDYNRCFEAAVIGAQKGMPWIKHILDHYDNRQFVLEDGSFDMRPLPTIFYKRLVGQYSFKRLKQVEPYQYESGVINVFSQDFFNSRNSVQVRRTRHSFCAHNYAGGWTKKNSGIKNYIIRLIPKWLLNIYFTITHNTINKKKSRRYQIPFTN